jgi:hypothetical protein
MKERITVKVPHHNVPNVSEYFVIAKLSSDKKNNENGKSITINTQQLISPQVKSHRVESKLTTMRTSAKWINAPTKNMIRYDFILIYLTCPSICPHADGV